MKPNPTLALISGVAQQSASNSTESPASERNSKETQRTYTTSTLRFVGNLPYSPAKRALLEAAHVHLWELCAGLRTLPCSSVPKMHKQIYVVQKALLFGAREVPVPLHHSPDRKALPKGSRMRRAKAHQLNKIRPSASPFPGFKGEPTHFLTCMIPFHKDRLGSDSANNQFDVHHQANHQIGQAKGW